MRQLFPNRLELLLLAVLALAIASVARWLAVPDEGLPFLLFPLLLAGMLMGARRTWSPSPQRQRRPDSDIRGT